MKSAQNLLCALRRKITLNIRDDKNQARKQHHNLDDIIQEKLNASANAA